MTSPAHATVSHTGDLETIHVGADQAIDLGYAVLVRSRSEADTWHVVTPNPSHCTCRGFHYRDHCAHLAIALEAQLHTAPVFAVDEGEQDDLVYALAMSIYEAEARGVSTGERFADAAITEIRGMTGEQLARLSSVPDD